MATYRQQLECEWGVKWMVGGAKAKSGPKICARVAWEFSVGLEQLQIATQVTEK